MYAIGVIFGSLGVIFLDGYQTKDLAFFVDHIYKGNLGTNNTATMVAAGISNLKIIAVVWVLGLTVIGIPLIAAVVFTRGFALGFTSAFLIKLKGLAGVVTVFLAIFPPNLVAIPLIILASASGIVFSLCILKRWRNGSSIKKDFFAFTVSMLIIAGLNGGVGMFQSYLTPLIVKVVMLSGGR